MVCEVSELAFVFGSLLILLHFLYFVALFGIVLSGPVELLDWTFSAASEPLPAGSSATSVVQLPNPVKFYGKTYSEVVVRYSHLIITITTITTTKRKQYLTITTVIKI